MEEGQSVAPGDRILYTVQLLNEGDAAASSPVALGPVPPGTVFLEGTVTSGADISVDYSIDGGKTFSPKPMVVIKAADGSTRTVPAPIDRYTTIRWNWNGSLAAGTQEAVSYQVLVR
jgi:uncharacterized repeat protein (TIGR01451 family)